MPDSEQSLMIKSLVLDGLKEIYLPEIKQNLSNKPKENIQASKPLNNHPAQQVPGTTEKVKSSAVRTSLSTRDAMIELRKEVLDCKRCHELCSSRKKVVFGAGTVDTDLVFIGEAPGRDEDEQGLPFVGAAGQLLTKIIEAIGYTRKEVFICNVLKCRPPANRSPKPSEIINCQGYLKEQIRLIKPKMICCLGNFAAQTLLNTQEPMAVLRQNFHEYEGVKVACTYHPAYLLRNPADKKKVWEDMQRMKKAIESFS